MTKSFDLYGETMSLINSSKMTPEEIAEKAGLKSRWLRCVIKGEIKDPGALKLQRVYDSLNKSHAK